VFSFSRPLSMRTENSYRRDVDGLRAIAVIGVVMYHVFPSVLPGGFTGVDIFFVISGFLISGIIWDRLADRKFSFVEFYARRIRRIFPALALVLFSTLFVGVLVLYPDERARLGKHVLSGAFFASNFVLWGEGGYFDIASEYKPLLHLWSLSIEEQFYLVWPFLLFIGHLARVPFPVWAGALMVMSFSINLRSVDQNSALAFFNPLARAWELLIGALISYQVRTRGFLRGAVGNISSVVGLALLLMSLGLFERASPYPSWRALVPVIGSAIILWCSPSVLCNRIALSSRMLVMVGLISYPLYLWHWPIFSLFCLKFMGAVPPSVGVGIVFGSLILATITYCFVEIPIRERRSGAKLAIVLSLSVFSVGALGSVVWRSGGFLPYLDLHANATYLREARSLDDWLREVRVDSCHIMSHSVALHPPHCVEQARPLLALWGDSFGAALYPGLHDLTTASSFGLAQLTSSSCPPLPRVRSDRPNCDQINVNIVAKLKELRPQAIVLSAAWLSSRYSMDNLGILDRLREQLMLLRATLPTTRLVVVGPIPRWGRPMRDILTDLASNSSQSLPRYIPLPVSEDTIRARKLEPEMRAVTESLGGRYVSAFEVFCQGEECLTRVSDSIDGLVSVDHDGHLNPKAASLIVARVKNALL
jgi:peptidoglycan/LPS O-acetylase OafA/YrhL